MACCWLTANHPAAQPRFRSTVSEAAKATSSRSALSSRPASSKEKLDPGASAAARRIASLSITTLVSAIEEPIRQAFVNGAIPSAQRATVLSMDSLMGSAGGVVTQPALGHVADAFGYPASYLAAAGIQTLALPFVLLARRERAPSDVVLETPER